MVVNHFLGVAPVPEPGMNLVDAAGAGRTPPGVLPTASDAYGNHVCLDGREGRDGFAGGGPAVAPDGGSGR